MFNEVIAITSLICALGALLLANRVYRKAPPWIDEKIEGIMGGFMEPDEEGKNGIDRIAERFGTSFRMSLMAQKSGQVRHEKMIENRVFEAVKENSPEIKIALQVLEKVGLSDLATPENMPALLNLANKYGLFGMMGNFNSFKAKSSSGNKDIFKVT